MESQPGGAFGSGIRLARQHRFSLKKLTSDARRLGSSVVLRMEAREKGVAALDSDGG